MYNIFATLLWYIAYVYSYFKDFSFTEMVKWYFYAEIDEPHVYVFENDKMVPWKFSTDKNSLIYVILKVHDRTKILIFNNRHTLIEKYGMLKDLVEHKMGKFSHYMEVVNIVTSEDHLELFNKYTDSGDTFFNDITNYNIKAGDLYDFRYNRFLLESNDKLEVVKMNLETIIYNFEDSLVEETKM
jgi:hypothetical protein